MQTPSKETRSGVVSYPPDNVAVGFGPMVGYVSGNFVTKDVWFDGSLLDHIKFSSFPFDWGAVNPGSYQLAFAILCEFEIRELTDRPIMLTYYKAFAEQMIAAMPRDNFALAIADVKEWLAAQRKPGVANG